MSRLLFLTAVLVGLFGVACSWSAAPPDKAEKPREARPAVRPLPTRAPVEILLQTVDFPGADDPKTNLAEVLEMLHKNHKLVTRVNERAFKAESVNDVLNTTVAEQPIPPMRATLARVLQRVLSRVPVSSGATYMVREDSVEITTRQAQNEEVPTERDEAPIPAGGRIGLPAGMLGALGGAGGAAPGAPAPAGGAPGVAAGGLGMLGGLAALDEIKKIHVPVVSVSLKDEPFEEAVKQIRAQSNMNLVLDPSLGDKAKTSLNVTLLNAPLDSAARVLTELAGIDFVWMDNIFFLTSKEKAESLRKKWPERHGGGIPGMNDSAAAGM
jgi:hypothetical protein